MLWYALMGACAFIGVALAVSWVLVVVDGRTR